MGTETESSLFDPENLDPVHSSNGSDRESIHPLPSLTSFKSDNSSIIIPEHRQITISRRQTTNLQTLQISQIIVGKQPYHKLTEQNLWKHDNGEFGCSELNKVSETASSFISTE